VTVALEQRMELYRTLVRLVSHLDPWRVTRSPVRAMSRADGALANGEHRS